MSDQRKGGIAWTEQTWNPLRGCSRVSEGCRNCYAERVAARFSGPGMPYEGLVTLGGPKGPRWNGNVRVVHEHMGDPLRWRRPRMVFVNSMSDLFHESVSFETIAAIYGVMAAAHKHTFQVLTKRPERAAEFFASLGDCPGHEMAHALCIYPHPWPSCVDEEGMGLINMPGLEDWPLTNVWLGVSVEDQSAADARVPRLLDLPGAVRWVSQEPQIGPVEYRPEWLTGLDWIVIGGESGPGARLFDAAWARRTIEQCRESGTAAFVKQLGARPAGAVGIRDSKGGDPEEWPVDLRVREWPT